MAAKIFRSQVEVRGYEADGFGHVNHAEYIHYMEYARWRLLLDEGIDNAVMKEWGMWPVVAEVQAKYLKPCFMSDILEIESWVTQYGRSQFYVQHRILKGESEVLSGMVRVVVVGANGKPMAFPPLLAEKLKQWVGEETEKQT